MIDDVIAPRLRPIPICARSYIFRAPIRTELQTQLFPARGLLYLGPYSRVPNTYTAFSRAGLTISYACSWPQQTRRFSSYTAAQKFLSGRKEGFGVLTLSMGQVSKSEWTGPRWPVATAVL